MSKTYFSRCAAVGIAGLTAMSSIAIVAAAATQQGTIYELKYNKLGKIGMINTAGYATGTNDYCYGDQTEMDKGFVVKLDRLLAVTTTYNGKKVDTDGKIVADKDKAISADALWGAIDFENLIEYADAGAWTYKEFATNYAAEPAKLAELYNERTEAATTDPISFIFKSEAEKNSAKLAMSNKIKTSYNTLAAKAVKQFNEDIDTAKKAALDAIEVKYNSLVDDANAQSDAKEKAAAKEDASAWRTAAKKAINDSATKIKNEFKTTFTSSNFRVDTNAFDETTYAVEFGTSFAGVTVSATFNGGKELNGAKYYAVSSKYVSDNSYAFTGEIQLKDDYKADNVNGLLINGNDWLNYEIINYNSNSGGNTNPSGGTTNKDKDKDKDTTTTNTTWYPDSESYRKPSEVSYQGKNGSWYTSSSAATIYGGGYTGTSKSSNYTEINNKANGAAIYFDSKTGTYSTSSSSYSYIVKEASSTANDPYYDYFFNYNGYNKNNNTTSVPAGSPAISGASKYAGWTNISSYLTVRGKSGATYTINMNDATTVPAAVLATAKSKNITLVFANDNGSKVTVKPGKVDTSSDLNVAVTYNVKDVKSSLVKKAKKVNSGTVSTAQIRVGDDGSIGGTETVTVKFSKKRSGCTVKAYRLTGSGSLKKEATGTVASTGRVNLNLTKGGSYLLVVIDD